VILLAAAMLYLCGRQRTMGEILINQNQMAKSNPPPSYVGGAGYNSMASNSAYGVKPFHDDIQGGRRYSGSGYGLPTDTESYRSRSPPIDETGGRMIPNMDLTGRRPLVPDSPSRSNYSNPISPVTSPSDGQRFQPMGGRGIPNSSRYVFEFTSKNQRVETDTKCRPSRHQSQQIGPHELPAEGTQPAYIPYPDNEYKGP
jgi:hypothetical protein